MEAEWLSTQTSPSDKCIFGSKPDHGGATISPTLRNPKKHMVAAVQSIVASLSDLSTYQGRCIWANRLKVIGSMLWGSPLTSLFTQHKHIFAYWKCLSDIVQHTSEVYLIVPVLFILRVAGAKPTVNSSWTVVSNNRMCNPPAPSRVVLSAPPGGEFIDRWTWRLRIK